MSAQQLTLSFLVIACGLHIVLSTTRRFRFYEMDRNAEHWQRIQHMPCTYRLFHNGFKGIMRCILQSTYDAESFMVGTNASNCIFCYYRVNGATLKAGEFQGTLLFKRGKLHPLLL